MTDSPSNLNSDSHGSLINQLCRLVNTIRQSNVNGQRSKEENREPETTSAAITRLFASVNRTRSSSHNTIRHNLYQAGQTSPDRANKKNLILKKSENSTTPVMKDVILLHDPRMKTVSRGRKKEELYARGFVAEAFRVTNKMTNV